MAQALSPSAGESVEMQIYPSVDIAVLVTLTVLWRHLASPPH